MNICKQLLSVSLLALIPMCACAMTITGTVADSLNQPLPFATITIDKAHRATSADKYGRFAIADLSAGTYDLRISLLGYAARHVAVILAEGHDADISVRLSESPIDMSEVVVATDMTTTIMNHLVAVPKLKKQLKNFHAVAECRIESTGNYCDFPPGFRSAVRMAAALFGYKKIFKCMEKYPDLAVCVRRDIQFDSGSISAFGGIIAGCNEGLTTEEKQAFLNKDWDMTDIPYDRMYSRIRKLRKKEASGGERLQYAGSYDEDGRRIHILKSVHYELHVAADIWQVCRMYSHGTDSEEDIECREVSGVLLPASIHKETLLDMSENLKWRIVYTTSYSYTPQSVISLARHRQTS